MKINLLAVLSGMVFTFAVASGLRADEVEMQNGDRYFGKVVSVSAKAVVLDSEILGKITVPRKQVTRLAFGTNAVAPQTITNAARIASPTNSPATSAASALANTNVDLSAELRALGGNTNFVGQIRDQLLGGNPEATGKYDQMVGDLLNGKLNMNDLRRQAQSSADQIRELKRDLGPDADDSLDGYLQVLDQFLKETANEPADTAPAPQPKARIP